MSWGIKTQLSRLTGKESVIFHLCALYWYFLFSKCTEYRHFQYFSACQYQYFQKSRNGAWFAISVFSQKKFENACWFHENKKSHSYTLCNLSSFPIRNLKIHIEYVLDNKKSQKWSFCNFSYFHKGSLKIHIQSVNEKTKP